MADMFDWNGDGKLDHWEKTNKALFIYNQTHPKKQEEASSRCSDGKDNDAGGGGIILFLLVLVIVFLFKSC